MSSNDYVWPLKKKADTEPCFGEKLLLQFQLVATINKERPKSFLLN